jgi:hypothetical protein
MRLTTTTFLVVSRSPLLHQPNLPNCSIPTQIQSPAEQQSPNNVHLLLRQLSKGTLMHANSLTTERTIPFVSPSSLVPIVIVLAQSLLATMSLPLLPLPMPIQSLLPLSLFHPPQTAHLPHLPFSIAMAQVAAEATKPETTSFLSSSRKSIVTSPTSKPK